MLDQLIKDLQPNVNRFHEINNPEIIMFDCNTRDNEHSYNRRWVINLSWGYYYSIVTRIVDVTFVQTKWHTKKSGTRIITADSKVFSTNKFNEEGIPQLLEDMFTDELYEDWFFHNKVNVTP